MTRFRLNIQLLATAQFQKACDTAQNALGIFLSTDNRVDMKDIQIMDRTY